jgi:ABC-type tungstate transport system substrate-binding protein
MTIRQVMGALCGASPRDKQNSRRILYWMLAWMGTWLGVGWSIRNDLLDQGLPAILASIVPTVTGIGAIFAYRRFLREADELRRKIELDALAVAFGVGLVGSLTYWLLGRSGAVAEVDLLWMVAVMMMAYGLSVFIGQVRYS